MCLDEADMDIQGNIGSSQAQILYVDIVICNRETEANCKEEEEIWDYFSRVQLTILKNQISFDQSKYGEEAIIKESRLDVIFLGEWHTRSIYEINKTELSLQDLAINMDQLTEL